MKCPKCGEELRRSKKDPNYGLCDNCRKKYKWVDDYEEDYEEDDEYIEEKPAKRKKQSAPNARSRSKHKKKNSGGFAIVIIIVLVILIAACILFFVVKFGDKDKDKDSRPQVNQETQQDPIEDTTVQEPEQSQTTPEPTDLSGTWKSVANEGSWMEATISADTISVDWVSDEGNTRSIYWVGTYTAPTEYVESYTWTSERNREQTDTALMASTDDTKDFSYSSGKLSYSVSLMGTTTQMELSR